MALRVVKAHAYGNDFLLAAMGDVAAVADLPALARTLCARHTGIGADGLMLVSPTPRGAATRLLNADGSRSEISGNGIRCVVAWLARHRNLGAGTTVVIDTEAGERPVEIFSRVGARILCRAAMGPARDVREETLDVAGVPVRCVVLNMGNPQCVVLGDAASVSVPRLHSVGAALAIHPRFPEGTNVELATVEAPYRVRILIWERGVGPTEASGTGACASAVAAATFAGASGTMDVVAPGGTQRVEVTTEQVWLTGWAEVIGHIEWWGMP
ncbi:MAG: diaminopimelate epimerase [Acidimicrobiia bacterium]|nr:diaminopimelate epimerase [Acidimicrobiia bacterium]